MTVRMRDVTIPNHQQMMIGGKVLGGLTISLSLKLVQVDMI